MKKKATHKIDKAPGKETREGAKEERPHVRRAYKDMSAQRLHPAEREAMRLRIKIAEARLLMKYPELTVWLKVHVDLNRDYPIAVDCAEHNELSDHLFIIYFRSECAAQGYFGYEVVSAFSDYGKASAYNPGWSLVGAPDTLLAYMQDKLDAFGAAVERTVRGALFLDPLDDEREDRPPCSDGEPTPEGVRKNPHIAAVQR